jgi:glycosyltransferase involved in cell wall biosynthesis
MKTLILLSKQFPFGNKEQYISHELKYLAEKFERVIIYPQDHFMVNDKITFDLPANCEVVDLNQKVDSINKLWPTLVFLVLYVREFFQTKKKTWWLKNARKFYFTWLTQWSLSNGLARYIRNNNLSSDQLIFYSYWFSNSAVCLSIMKMRGLISGFVCRAHALDLYHEDWKAPDPNIVSLPFRYFKQRRVTKVFPISKHGSDYLLQSMPAHKLEKRYLGVFDFGLNPPQAASNEFVVVSCSGVDERKRIHLIGQALSNINKPVRWIHFGDGPLKQRAIESVTAASVIFEYRGQTPNPDIRKFYAENHVDLFINVSLSEGLPVAIMECMSHGIPAIGVQDFGTSEIVISDYSGQLLPQGFTLGDLEAGILFFMNASNPGTFRQNARTHFENYFNADKNYRQFALRLSEF